MSNNKQDYVIDQVGLANIFEKRETMIEGQKLVYYVKIDYSFGYFYSFGDGVSRFAVLTGKLVGQLISSNSAYTCADFKTVREFCRMNNGYCYDKFINSYQQHIGEYYSWDTNKKNRLVMISDPDLLRKIKSKTEDYDDKILDNATDISQMYSKIKETIVSQDEQIMKILTSLFKNQRVINSSLSDDVVAKLKENIIVYGPTGTGKTEILKRIASLYGVPIVIEDATSLSETGYIGRNITDMLEDLYLAAGKDIEKAQKGILVIDEFDKLAEKDNRSHDHVSRIGVQRSLLKLLDGSIFYFAKEKFDTSKLSVVVLGAFTGIVADDDYSNASQKDFVDYGIMRELIGRFSKFVAMKTLSKEDIKRILVESDFSPINTYRLLFESMNIEFSYDDSFIDYIAEEAVKLNSGARSLKTIFDDSISSAMFRIFAGEYSSIHLTGPTTETKSYILREKA